MTTQSVTTHLSKTIKIDAAAFNDSHLRIECAKAIITALGIFINECEEIPVSNSLIHDALFGADMLLDDAVKGLCNEPKEVAA